MESGHMKSPTLRECWDDVHSWDDFKEFFPLLVPRSVLRASRWVTNPRSEFYCYKKNRWCKSRKVGDWVCDCRGEHTQIAEFGSDSDLIVTTDGFACSLFSCCSEIDPDNKCHGPADNAGYVK